eukprot:CAMPEP_0201484756 /NCGR_PEP_ID=MMETSP0151_2-20130828/8906_1 /ASSEMBLY_ACC=CAM_ASM_000257 /TAXON_ID=200890 /ORGANISM="Paramoeba atlantica, Strain 621/1 / CCAP 1560/9" /LENGTH=414 /DNA_ID=CAMNT_0047868561 /DNA_START=332 /DNA_END=1576 /DNA_ORIENTATION=+
MNGFGGALTDSAAINIFAMKEGVQKQIINSYYGDDGLQYSLGRFPMAGCDFSTYTYTYCDTPNDFDMETFNVSVDMTTKIPLGWMAQNASSQPIKWFSSPWSAPVWMKTSGDFVGGSLIGTAGDKYHQSWALYYSKYLQSYQNLGLPIWGVTAQNEPTQSVSWNSMFWTAEQQRDWIKTDLGPQLEQDGFGDVKIMILDDQRNVISDWVPVVLGDPDAYRYVAGTGVHWYVPSFYSALTNIHEQYPDKFILATEACNGYLPLTPAVKLGDWGRAENYVSDMIADISNWATGWTDWNIALDLEGGPNWANNFVDSPIIANTTSGDVFYKQPMFYAMGHFSKFVRPGTQRMGIISSTTPPSSVEAVAFQSPETTVIVLLNQGKNDFSYSVFGGDDRGWASNVAPGHSFQTIIFNTE